MTAVRGRVCCGAAARCQRPLHAVEHDFRRCIPRPRLNGDVRPFRHEKEEHGWPRFIGPRARKSSGRAAGPGQDAKKQGAKKGGGPAQEHGPATRMDAGARRRAVSWRRHHGRPSASAPRPQGHGEGPAPAGVLDPHADARSQRYEQPIASREAHPASAGRADGPMAAEALAAEARPGRARPLRRAGQAPRRDAARRPAAAEPPRRLRRRPQRLDLIAGTVIANPDGFGFLRTGRRRRRPVPAALRDAQGDARRPRAGQRHRHGPPRPPRRRDRRGARAPPHAPDRPLRDRMRGIGYVVPDDRRIQHNVLIPPDAARRCEARPAGRRRDRDQRTGYAAPADRPHPHRAGRQAHRRRWRCEAAIHGHGLPHEFPQAVLDEAAAVPLTVDAATAAERVDLRATAAGHHRRRGRQGLRRRGVVRTQPRRLPPGRRDRRRLALRAARHAARRRGAEARDLGVLPGLRRADAAGDAVQRHLLAQAEGRPPVLRLRHADRPRRRGHPVEVLRSGDALACAPDLHAGLEGGRRAYPTTQGGRARADRRAAAACRAPAPALPGARQGARTRAARSNSNPAKCASCSARRAKSCRPACCSATTRTS